MPKGGARDERSKRAKRRKQKNKKYRRRRSKFFFEKNSICSLQLLQFPLPMTVQPHAKHKGFVRSVINISNQGPGAEGSNRVNRGGSWNNNARNARVANRNNDTPANRNNNLGFRLACSSKQQLDFEQAPLSFPVTRAKTNLSCPVSSE